jgi:hypothetical protein
MAKNKKQDSWVLDVQEDENGDAVIEFPPDLLAKAGWQEGDCLQWRDLGDGTWSLSKSKTAADDDSWDDVFKNQHRDKDAGESSITATVTREAIEQVHQLMQVTDMDTVDVVMSRSSSIGPMVLFRFRGTIDGTDYSTW